MKQIRRFFALFFIPILFHFYSHADLSNIQPGQSIWCISKEIGSVVDVLSDKIPANFQLDVSLLVETICSKIEIVQNADIVAQSLLCDAISTIDEIELCMSITVTGSTTITEPGLYCVSVNFAGNVVIDANEVTLDINNHVITGAVEILSDQSNVIIQNGVVDNDNLLGSAILANSGTSNITLRDVTTKNAQVGINFEGVTGGTIANCSMVQNITGLELDQSHKIVIDNCTADCNVNAGYCLISSTTNIIQNCKAISTGESNTQTFNQTIFGFVTSNGFGNIFERCIANSTQALSTTDSQSLVAGFALRGSEGCSKIIESESSNTQTNVSGFSIPYGILLEAQFDNFISITGAPGPISGPVSPVWSPDGNYLAFGNQNLDGFNVYELNRAEGLLNLVVMQTGSGDLTNRLSWSPDGNYLAVSYNVSGTIEVYKFDQQNISFKRVATQSQTTAGGLAWSPDGNYLAVLTGSPVGGSAVVYNFDKISESISFVTNVTALTFPFFLSWSPDGNYLAIGTGSFAATPSTIKVYKFDSISPSLTLKINESFGVSGIQFAIPEWSPNGKYLAVGASTTDIVRIYEFNSVLESVTPIIDTPSNNPRASWSADGNYLAVNSTNTLTMYAFDRAARLLTPLDTQTITGISGLAWNPDGSYIAIFQNGASTVSLYKALTFPSKNVITNNTVYCNSGAQTPSGIGISGSSIANLIIGNTAYNNPQNPFMVPTNYAFVTNVFNPLFGSEPTALQNISIGGCDTIVQSDDQALLIKQVTQQIILADTILDIIESKLEELISQQDILAPCSAILVTGSTTISQQGIYCVAQPFNGSVTINASDVELRLNNYTITGDVQIGAFNNVVVRGGTIDNNNALGNALGVSSGATNINVNEVTVKNAQVGINFDGVTGGTITNCSMVQNVTGLELDQSHKIVIDNCTADCNINAGFSLVSSTTNIIQDSKALSTGQGNQNTENQMIFGFVSADGYSNIFERCIANSTQALSTTDSQSLVAGFALRGDEGCTKIINCESGNTQTDVSGVTIPYGILLEPTIDSNFTGLNITPVPSVSSGLINHIAWSSDGKYVSLGVAGITGTTTLRVLIYEFDRQNTQLTRLVGTLNSTIATGACVLSPDGSFLATSHTSNTPKVRIYAFDAQAKTLTQVATPDINPSGTVEFLAWHPSGRYLAVPSYLGNVITVYKFDPVALTLTQFALPDQIPTTGLRNASWSPDGQFLVVASGALAGFTPDEARVYRFDEVNAQLIQVAVGTGVLPSEAGFASAWSPDGKYILVSYTVSGFGTFVTAIYSFDGVSTLELVNSSIVETGSNFINNFSWSSDSQYFALGTDTDARVYYFDRGTHTPILVAQSAGIQTQGIAWSPDGEFIAYGSQTANPRFGLREAFTFPSKNIITNNIVYCNSGGSIPSGIGISGSSIANMIIGNTSYNNPQNPFMVPANYVFVTNVFNPLFQAEPTALQNISIGGCDQIPAPDNTLLLAQQVKGLSTQTKSIMDILEGYADDIIEALFPPCRPVHIVSPTTITASGIYCLGQNVTGSILIDADDVQLDLSNHIITGDVSIAAGKRNITAKNGVIDNNNQSSDALLVNSGTSNVNVDNLLVRNAQIGINFDGVTGGTISNCSMVQNVTGVQLDTSNKIRIDNCVASCNRNIGYSLSSSSTNVIQDCKALSTGEGNNETLDQAIFGFVSNGGYGNIFERCIVDGTQGLQVTDSNSLVAGFALCGSENCTKIIDSESANTQTNQTGLTIPYGIIAQENTHKNIIMQNVVYCTAGAQSGIGIFGNNVNNLIIQNTIYNNPIGMQVGSNLDEIISFIDAPTELQNIVVPGCDAIAMPEDITLLAQQIKAKECNSLTLLDEIESKLDLILSDTNRAPCFPITITASQLPTTITSSGVYCLAENTPVHVGNITINADDVELLLNNRTLQGSIAVNGANARIIEGVIDANGASTGISANSGADNILVSNVRVQDAIVGIALNGMSGGTVEHCTLSQNYTGLLLNSSHKISVDSCIADCNLNVGFDLINSTTNFFMDCKAISTGQGNNGQFVQTIVGFMSKDGSANIFEKCIANDTHGSQVADEASWVAGFLLQGNEQCSKIINCESANTFAGLVLTDTNIAPLAVPQGITLEIELLEESVALLDQQDSGGSVTTGGFMHVAWSPDNEYVAVTYNNGLNSVGGLFVYKFDKATGLLTKTVGTNNPLLSDPPYTNRDAYGVAWSPNGQYIVFGKDAASGSTQLFMSYEFNRDTFELSFKDSLITSIALGMAFKFTSNGEYCFSLGRGDIVRSFPFDQSTGLIGTQIDSYTPSGAIHHMMDISPDDKFLAIGTNTFIDILPTNGDGTFNLSQVLSLATPSLDVIDLAWHPSGRYLAIATFADKKIHMYAFNGTFPLSLTPVGTTVDFNINTGGAFSLLNKQIAWAPRGDFLVVTLNNTNVRIYSFDFDSGQLTTAQNFDTSTGPLGLSFVGSVDWSSDGRYIAISNGYPDSTTGPNPGVEGLTIINSGYVEPQKNIIMRNTVYCTSGGGGGIGVYANNVANLIIQNTIYNNPIGMQVGSNLDEIISSIDSPAPTILQNIVIPGCDAIAQPIDVPLLVSQLKPKLIDAVSSVEIFATAVDDFLSAVDELVSGCGPTVITFAPTTISMPGIYCLSQTVTGDICIDASNVELDLNTSAVNGSVLVNGGENVLIKNGIVDNNNADGIALNVNGGAHNVSVVNVVAKNASVGINFDDVTGGVISRCSITQNSTGLQLEYSHKIDIRNCTAIGNSIRGFSLISSTTNVVSNCKALNTGFGNMQTFNNSVFGFVCENGSGNILEECIANATQALTTTDFVSQIAGIAFLGTEECGKIIGCEAGNAKVSPDGFSIPRGILLQSRFEDETLTLTATPAIPEVESPRLVFSVDWSPDSQFLAVGAGGVAAPEVRVYKYDYILSRITLVASEPINGLTAGTVQFMGTTWDPSGKFIAVVINTTSPDFDAVQIYSFSAATNSLEFIANTNTPLTPANANYNAAPDWDPTGKFIAYATSGQGAANDGNIFIDQFNPIAGTLNSFAQRAVPVSGAGTTQANFVKWDRSGKFLAAGIVGEIAALGSVQGALAIYEVQTTNINEIALVGRAGGGGFTPADGAWSPDGTFLAVVDSNSEFLLFYQFLDGVLTNVFQAQAPANGILADAQAIEWSSDGNYVVFAGSDGTQRLVRTYFYDRSNNTVSNVATSNIGFNSSVTPGFFQTVSWSLDGGLIAAGANSSGTNLFIYEALKFPQKNVIKNNTVYCNSGGLGPSGVGLSGSSIANLILNNVSYANPVAENVLFDTNYSFVTNVFNPNFSNTPNDLQNLSIGGCQPLRFPVDLPALVKGVNSAVDALRPTITELESKIDMLMFPDPDACLPIGIAGSSVPTTISVSGIYCLAQTSTGDITITADDVELRMNNQRLTGSIIVSGANARISEGLINANGASAGIAASNTADGILLSKLRVHNAIVGIQLDGVSGGVVEYCTLSQNTTGVQLNSAHKIVIDECLAQCNLNAGFDLINSTINIIQDCKALSTGEGNTNFTNQTVFGFVASNGNGNIFERCIANSTQALSTTDVQSLVAGFALRGSEGCTKIIECESGNTQTSSVGSTIPTGILIEDTLSDFNQLSSGTTVMAMDWSPDGKYLATIRNSSATVTVYEIKDDRLILLTTFNNSQNNTNNNDIAWSPNGNYIALVSDTAGNQAMDIYEFDALFKTITRITTRLNEGRWSVSWSSDSKFLAAGGEGRIYIYEVDPLTSEFTLIQNLGVDSTFGQTARWSPCDKYLVSGSDNTNGRRSRLFTFNSITKQIAVAQVITIGSSNRPGQPVAWSPDSKYVALGSADFTTSLGTGALRIYELVNGQLVERAVGLNGGSLINQFFAFPAWVHNRIDWSPDGKYVFAGNGNSPRIVYAFDRSANALIQVATSTGLQAALALSPDGRYIATADSFDSVVLTLRSGLDYPSKNVITNNIVYCNSGGVTPLGIGINGSSVLNMITNNVAYNNPMNPFAIETNYAAVLNVFNPLFQNEPTTLQNISIAGCDAIAMPADLALLTEQFTAGICSVIDSAIMQSAFDVIADITPTYTPVCVSTAITTVPTTINFAGTYCLAQTSTGDITINASDVSLNLNNHILNGAVLADGYDQLIIRNGTINATGINGIFILNGADITTQDVAISNALVGIAYQNISGGFIKNCTLTQNSTGVQLENSHKIIVDSCVASCNTNAGFDLINSTTNIVQSCKALSTGEGNIQTADQTIIGFVSSNGYANIFEQCIANGTQGLHVADSGSLVAGFALRGDERCTKIIASESGNTQTNANGGTVPYGMLLEVTLNDPIITVTSAAPGGDTVEVRSAIWSPDGNYLAVGINSGNNAPDLYLYEFNAMHNTLMQLGSGYAPGGNLGGTVRSCDWSPDGNYLVVGIDTGGSGTNHLYLYEFNRSSKTLTELSSYAPDGNMSVQVLTAVWSPDGNYVAVGIDTGVVDPICLFLYEFDSNSKTLTQLGSGYAPTGSFSSACYAVAWSPNGNYLAVGMAEAIYPNNDLYVYEFNRSSESLIMLGSGYAPGGDTTVDIHSVDWSPDGSYLAVGLNGNPNNLFLFEFDQENKVLTPSTGYGYAPGGDTNMVVYSVNWSPDGNYLAVGIDSFDANDDLYLFEFDRANKSLTPSTGYGYAPGGDGTVAVYSVNWSPDGKYLAVGAANIDAGITDDLWIYNVISSPSKNVIKDNTVYCNSGGSLPYGVGISGSSIQNMIIGNTAYNNPQNYTLVTNVYNPLFELSPTAIQNISLGGCVPIAQQENLALLVNQIDYKVNQLFGCQPTPITTSNISSGTISLTTAGSYCLATDLTANMVIAADCIAVDLNERTLTGLVTVQMADQVTVQNGRVSAPAPSSSTQANRAAVGVASTARNVQINNVIVRCANTTTDGVHGRSGIVVQGNNVQVTDCSILSGAGANSTGSPAGSGGFGIVVNSTAQKTLLQNNAIITGMGGVSSAVSGMGGDGGIGICVVASAQDTSVIGCTVLQTGGGGSAVDTMAGTGGLGGDGIAIADANKTLVTNCIVRNAGLAGQPLPLKDLPGGIEMIFHGRALTDLLAPGVGTPGSIAHGTTSYNITNLQPIIFQSLVDDLNQESAWALAPQGNMIEPILDGMGMQIGEQLVGVGDFSNVVLQGEPQPSPQDQITAAQNAGQIISSGAKIGEGTFVSRATAIVPN